MFTKNLVMLIMMLIRHEVNQMVVFLLMKLMIRYTSLNVMKEMVLKINHFFSN